MNPTLALTVLLTVTGCAAESTSLAQRSIVEEKPPLASKATYSTYAERVIARIKPNLTIDQIPPDNTFAELEVRCNSHGRIVSTKIVRSSGLDAWDKATVRAVERTEYLPRDGTRDVPPVFTIVFRPN
jgi:colicin import membrane protein